MGEIADMMLDGTFCQACGGVMPDVTETFEAPGYPRTCPDCGGEKRPGLHLNMNRTAVQRETGKHKCPVARCKAYVSNSFLMCQVHWYMVPGALQQAVHNAYRRGQTVATATPTWFMAAEAAADAVEVKLILRDTGKTTPEAIRALNSAPIGTIITQPTGRYKKVSKTGWVKHE